MDPDFDFSKYSPKAQKAGREWQEDIQNGIKELLSEPLRILIWGPCRVEPGTVGQERKALIAAKRAQIKEELIARGHFAIFSEDWPLGDPEVSEFTQLIWEYQQAVSSHLVILLIEESPGGQGELNNFAMYEQIVVKLFIMFPYRYKSSYTAMGIGRLLTLAYQNVYWYQDDEIENCNVLTAALKKAASFRELAALRKLKGPI